MTEVDAVVPEAVSLPAADSLASETVAATTNNIQPVKDQQQNGTSKPTTSNIASETMEVDGIETEEDDSQITSSTENGVIGGVGEDSKLSEDVISKPATTTENSKESLEQEDGPLKSAATINEDSSNECDDGDPFAEEPRDDSQDSEAKSATADTDGEESSCSDSQPKQPIAASDTEGEIFSQDDESSNAVKSTNHANEVSIDAKDLKSNDSSVNAAESTAEDPLPVDDLAQIPVAKQKENGVASELEKASKDSNIVDLDDDSDEEEEDDTMEAVPTKAQQHEETSNGDPIKGTTSVKKARSVCSDSDGAVVIGSDSESEVNVPPPAMSKPSPAPKSADPQIIDDDDDDCVVIEDDTPAPAAVAVGASDLSKRKSLAMDTANNSDDSQPPSKRQRGMPQSPVIGLNQITIKDARSLMPQDAIAAKPSGIGGGGVYPVNITPSAVAAQGPPKLVPVGGASLNAAVPPLSVLPGLSSNANMLPGLTDDMYVLEAPSFIVPYIYEKPPNDQLKDIVREIETKYKLSKEDLAEADKSDEFDMMTEQNKKDKEERAAKKKKRRRGIEEPDESWSEESEEDDDEDDEDDDDSESGVRTKVLIKEAADDLTAIKGAIKPASAVVQSPQSTAAAGAGVVGASPTSAAVKPGQENYFESPLGKFFMDIGVGLVQEFVQSDLLRLQKRKMRKSLGKNITEFERAISALSGNLEASKKKNSAFKFTMKRCEFCNFKSESALSMANHYETPHMNGPLYKCNFCIFEIRNATEIVYHMEAVHNIKARLIKPLPYHTCPNCGFEDNGKAKLARHQPVCAKKFRPEQNLCPPNDWEAPAKIPRIKPRHGLVGTATAYQAMAAQAAAQKAALASIQQQQQAAQARSLQAAAIAAANAANKLRGRPPAVPIGKPGLPNNNPVLRGPSQVRNPMATNVVLPNNYQLAGGQLIQTANAMAKKTLSGQPSISITPLPRQSATAQASAPSTSNKMPPAGMKPGQTPSSGNKAQFVICEICDGYIKDLEQLRNHMQWMHKVKIHPKMIYNRPPLNCQKCQFRFFTDQGLERHLLGSHGLVTSSMQEAANKGKDAGRCPVCGRMYQWKLLNHVSRDHHMTLKPAHLSYKCTVCTATFGMYKQFETHVYTAHSTVAKKAMDGKKTNAAMPGAGASSSSNQRNSLGAVNDSLLKPLKINDEITIIPQPASKPRITNMESHVID